MKRLTLRTSTIISVTLIGLSFILLSTLAGNFFRQAAIDAQVTSLSRIIEVASQEILRNLQRHALNLGTSVNTNNHLAHALQNNDEAAVIGILDDPFSTGFVGATDVELMKVRTYNLDFSPLHQSSRGDQSLEFKLPPYLHAIASTRRGADRLKAIGGLWVSPGGPRYSVLLPIGGLHIKGYTEVVFDPLFTLHNVSDMTSMPVSILLPDEPYTAPAMDKQHNVVLPIEYTLIGHDGQVAYRLIGLENINKFNQDMLQTLWVAVIGFLTLIFGIMLAALWVLRIGLFRPLGDLMQGIEAYSDGQLDTRIKPGGLKELYTLGHTFNDMLQRICDDIRELERYSTLDGLTGIPNRRLFDQRLDNTLGYCKRNSVPLSVLYIDIDYFKQYNDHYGHLAGDDTLKKVAAAVADMARRDTDIAARLGGEEFAVLLPDTIAEYARLVAENLRLAVADLAIAHAKSDISDQLTISVGVASFVPQRDSSANEYIAMADKALYQAKSDGRDRVVVA